MLVFTGLGLGLCACPSPFPLTFVAGDVTYLSAIFKRSAVRSASSLCQTQMNFLCRLLPNFLFVRLCCKYFPAVYFRSILRSLLVLGRTNSMRTLGRQETHTTEYRPSYMAWQPNGRHSATGFLFQFSTSVLKRRYQTEEMYRLKLVPSRNTDPGSTGISTTIAKFAICEQALRENFLGSEKFSFQTTTSYLMTDFFPRLDISFIPTFIKEILSNVTRRRINFSTLNF